MSLNIDKSEWKRVRFGDVVASSKEKVDPTDGSVDRYVAGEHMDTDDLRIHRSGDVTEKDLGPAFHRRFRPGQVLYGSRRTYLRKVSVAEFDGVCANTTFVVETADNTVLLQEFLPFVMSSEPFHAHAIGESKGSVNPYVNWSDIAKFEFDLPPLDEQQRIADLLWAVEPHRSALSLTAAKLNEVANVAFSTHLAGRGMSTVPLPELVREMTVGVVVRPMQYYTDAEDGVPALRGLNVRPGRFELSDLVKFRRDSALTLTKSTLRKGDVVIVRSGRPGDAAVVTDEVDGFNCIDLIIARPGPRLLPEYLALYLNSSYGRNQVTRRSAGTAQQHFNVGALKKLEVPELDISEQRQLVEQAGVANASVDQVSTERDALNNLRASILTDIHGGS